MKTITGKFEVKGSPLDLDETSKSLGLMRMRFDKKFEGPLSATSFVSMMGMMDQAIGSGAYVALEKVTGTVDSRSGSFCLMHASTMFKGSPRQSITVVPDSGTGELVGLEGSMVIEVVNGQHSYSFNYKLHDHDHKPGCC